MARGGVSRGTAGREVKGRVTWSSISITGRPPVLPASRSSLQARKKSFSRVSYSVLVQGVSRSLMPWPFFLARSSSAVYVVR